MFLIASSISEGTSFWVCGSNSVVAGILGGSCLVPSSFYSFATVLPSCESNVSNVLEGKGLAQRPVPRPPFTVASMRLPAGFGAWLNWKYNRGEAGCRGLLMLRS